MGKGSPARRGRADDDAALRLVQQHAAELLRFARRFCHCADDAHDAYQRAAEILVRRMRVEPPERPLSWMRTVLRHEALSIRAERERLVGRFEVDLDRHEDRHVADPAERVVGHERLDHAAEALRRLKPQEVTALVLRAEGLSYKEICARTGWTYTRCNRAVTEGRRALLERLGAIESGAECARWLPLLSSLADGEASARDVAELRPHLRACPACRATLRRFHAAPSQVSALVPVALLPAAADPGWSLLRHVELALHSVSERAALLAMRLQGSLEAVPGTKLAAVAASTAAIAGGGVAIERAADQPRSAAVARGDVRAASAPLTAASLAASPFGARPAGARTQRASRDGRRGEFAGAPAGDPEFASRRGTSGPEFSSTAAASSQPPAREEASAATSPPQFAASPPRPSAEFDGP